MKRQQDETKQDDENQASELFSEVLLAYYEFAEAYNKFPYKGRYRLVKSDVYYLVKKAILNSRNSIDPDSLEKGLRSIFYDGGGQAGNIVIRAHFALDALKIDVGSHSGIINPGSGMKYDTVNQVELRGRLVSLADYAIELMNRYVINFYNPLRREMGKDQLRPLPFIQIFNDEETLRGPPDSYLAPPKKKTQNIINVGVVMGIGSLIKKAC